MKKYAAEIVFLSILLAVSVHLLSERIEHRSFPGGDEGSWMNVAAQVARGQGFTTRWLEHPFLTPYSLPRPDDYRFPALVTALAAGFKLAGISYRTALWVVGVIFLLYLVLMYVAVRKYFGIRPAVAASACAAVSLLQLTWNSAVYTEGLFGAVCALVIVLASRITEGKRRQWVALGAAMGLLYLVRPNGILLAAGFIAPFLGAGKTRRPWNGVAFALCAMLMVMSPWLVRNALWFGNPFHVAGSAGLLRVTSSEPLTYSVGQFLSIHGPWYPVKATIIGVGSFFKTLHFFEHGLEIVPLAFCAVGLARRVPMYNGFVGIGLLASFFACAYASRGSWAGVRYFSPLLPFVYAYGFYVLFGVLDRLCARTAPRMARFLVLPFVVCIACVPVLYPHRYYERVYGKQSPASGGFDHHVSILYAQLSEPDAYFADRMGQISFLTRHRCVGIQVYFDSTDVDAALRQFTPKLVALMHDELRDPRIRSIMTALERRGRAPRMVDADSRAVYFRIDSSQQPKGLGVPVSGQF